MDVTPTPNDAELKNTAGKAYELEIFWSGKSVTAFTQAQTLAKGRITRCSPWWTVSSILTEKGAALTLFPRPNFWLNESSIIATPASGSRFLFVRELSCCTRGYKQAVEWRGSNRVC